VGRENTPNFEFMQDVFGHLPLLIVQLTVDGIVVSVNNEVCKITGYSNEDIVGQNWWGTMFPGKLFRQVPKFISAVAPVIGGGVLRDVPMMVAAKDGQLRTIAWTRFTRDSQTGGNEIVLIGMDLTDRLTDADREATGEATVDGIEGTIVTPILASPPKLSEDHGLKAIQEVHEFLSQVETRIDALEGALMIGELEHVATLAGQLDAGAHACGLLHVSSAARRVYLAAAHGEISDVTRGINDLVGLCRGNDRAIK
jgi:PAS domain S-box-containing protein